MAGYRKGIILAGGRGSRLSPMTNVVNKQLLPVYDKPMVYYPLATLMSAAISDILIISTPDQINNFNNLFGTGEHLGLSVKYAVQDKPRGLADAFLVAEANNFLTDEDPAALALGDNIFYGEDFYKDLMYISKMNTNWVFGYRVSNPQDYGVVDFCDRRDRYSGKVQVNGIDEKPEIPKSNYAVPGLYFYDNTVLQRTRTLKPSERNELEITDLNNSYIEDRKLNVKILRDNAAWFDTGSADSMFEAAMFVKSIQSRTGQMIGCVEEVAWKKNMIDDQQFLELVDELPQSQYKKYLTDKFPLLV